MTQTRYAELAELDRLLEQANPVDVDDLPDSRSVAAEALYSRLVDRVGGDGVRRERRLGRRDRRLLAAAFAAALLLLSGAAIAAVNVVPWWQDGEPPVNPEIVDPQLAPRRTSRSRRPPTARVRGLSRGRMVRQRSPRRSARAATA